MKNQSLMRRTMGLKRTELMMMMMNFQMRIVGQLLILKKNLK